MNSNHATDTRVLVDIKFYEKENLPVSITKDMNGASIVVSRYQDEIWDFYPYIPQENLASSFKMIRWNVLLPDGKKLTDPTHRQLLNSAKDFIWSLFSAPVDGRKRAGMSTLIAKSELLQPLLRWMVINNFNRFSDIKESINEYIYFAKKRSNKDEIVSPMTFYYRLHIIEYLYHQRGKIKDAIEEHPWPHETAQSLSGKRRGGNDRKPTTQYIPDEIANHLATVALKFIQEHSKQILPTLYKIQNVTNEENVRLNQSQVDLRTELARAAGFSGMNEFYVISGHLRTACYIIIDMFSGIRDSEMMSLTVDCLTSNRSSDDTTDLLYLHGTIYKTGVRAKKWIVPPIVLEAVEVLRNLTASLRKRLYREEIDLRSEISTRWAANDVDEEINRLTKRLHIVSSLKNNIFLAFSRGSYKVSALTGHMLNPDLKRFCRDNGILGRDGVPYPLHAHQFRRTYARFIARAELGDLLVLREHFGHWSLDMTLYYIDGSADEFEVDFELLEMVSNEKNVRQTEILGSHLMSDAPLANGGHWLKEWRSSVQTATNKESLIAEYSGTITLTGTGHSWCVGNGRSIGCGGLCVFEAPMCVDCAYGIIGQEHRPVWNGIKEQQLEAIALNDMGPGGLERAEKILGYAKTVLKRLETGK